MNYILTDVGYYLLNKHIRENYRIISVDANYK